MWAAWQCSRRRRASPIEMANGMSNLRLTLSVACILHRSLPESSLLDRSRPLWEFYVIEGLVDGRIGFYSKVHHAAVDGQAAVAMGNSVFDFTAEPRRVKPPRPARSNRYQLGVAELLGAALTNQASQAVQLAKLVPPLGVALLQTAREAISKRRAKVLGNDQAAGTRLMFAPATPFNSSITNQRAFAGVSLPLGEVKQIGKGFNASINDMVLWLCRTALREYLKDSRELPPKTLVAGMPISLRSEGDTSNNNNQVSGTLIDLATQVADPIERLQAIMAGTRAVKAQMGTFVSLIPTDFPSVGSPWLLSGLASLYGRSRIADRLRIANVVISNVPGPQVPLYLAGAKMSATYPLSIVVHGIALNITVQSYMGQLCFGLISCRRAMRDVDSLGAHLVKAIEILRALPVPAQVPAQVPAEVEDQPVRAAPKSVPAVQVKVASIKMLNSGVIEPNLIKTELIKPGRARPVRKPVLKIVNSPAKTKHA